MKPNQTPAIPKGSSKVSRSCLMRPNLQYHPDGHPLFSKVDLENYGTAFVKAYFPANLTDPQPLAPAAIIELVHRVDMVEVKIMDLGREGNRKRLGRTYLKRGHIVLDQDLFTPARQVSLPFVLAHELAHWLLHRDCNLTAIREQTNDQFEDDVPQPESRLGWTALEWLEWQANKLAGTLLMPSVAALNAIYWVQGQMGIIRQRGLVFQNTSIEGRIETDRQLGLIADKFQVSKTVAKIRLQDLRLFEVQPNEGKPDPFAWMQFNR